MNPSLRHGLTLTLIWTLLIVSMNLAYSFPLVTRRKFDARGGSAMRRSGRSNRLYSISEENSSFNFNQSIVDPARRLRPETVFEKLAWKMAVGSKPEDYDTIVAAATTVSNGGSTLEEQLKQRSKLQRYISTISGLRVGIPSLALATAAKIMYPSLAHTVADIINDPGVFDIVGQDASQFIQNILTTSGLVFSLIIGQTYYFMVSQTMFACIVERCLVFQILT